VEILHVGGSSVPGALTKGGKGRVLCGIEENY
jgi:hypothetical protein